MSSEDKQPVTEPTTQETSDPAPAGEEKLSKKYVKKIFILQYCLNVFSSPHHFLTSVS